MNKVAINVCQTGDKFLNASNNFFTSISMLCKKWYLEWAYIRCKCWKRLYKACFFWLNRKIKQKSIDEHMFMRYYIYNFGGDESGLYSNEL